jgi:hypothetical protein
VFARIKKSGSYRYVQVVHNERIEGKVRQRVIATLGRLDVLKWVLQTDTDLRQKKLPGVTRTC